MDQVRMDQIVSAGLLLSEICVDDGADGGDCPNCRLHVAQLCNAPSSDFEAELARSEQTDTLADQTVALAPVVMPPQRAPPRHV